MATVKWRIAEHNKLRDHSQRRLRQLYEIRRNIQKSPSAAITHDYNMAALISRATLRHSFIVKYPLLTTVTAPARNDVKFKHNWNIPRPEKITAKWEWDEKSLASRGFLRCLKPYTPPSNVSERLVRACQAAGIAHDDNTIVEDLSERFKLFIACEKEFNHTIPNSMLYDIKTIGDLKRFYETPVISTPPLDAAKNRDLPKNLHILYDYHRFHPDTDTKFGGKTAYPRSSTLVTGLKTRKKYPNLILKSPFESMSKI